MVARLIEIALDVRAVRLSREIADEPVPMLGRFLAIMRSSPALSLMRGLDAHATDELCDLWRFELELQLVALLAQQLDFHQKVTGRFGRHANFSSFEISTVNAVSGRFGFPSGRQPFCRCQKRIAAAPPSTLTACDRSRVQISLPPLLCPSESIGIGSYCMTKRPANSVSSPRTVPT